VQPHNKLLLVIFAAHIFGVAGVVYYWDPVWFFATVLGVFLLGSLGLECYLHRYLTHQSYKLHPAVEVFLHLCSIFVLQGPPLNWAANHIAHHKYADTDKDPHPAASGWKSWLWIDTYKNAKFDPSVVRRLMRNQFCKWSAEHYFKIYLCGIALAIVIEPKIAIYGLFIPAVLMFHSAGFVIVGMHKWGYRNFDTPDKSTNLLLGVFFLGNPFHNNHHAHPGKFDNSVHWYELDWHSWVVRLIRSNA